jgi:hypothetical protein
VATNCAATSSASRASDFESFTVFGSGATSCTRPLVSGASLLCPVFEKKTPRIAASAATPSTIPTLRVRLRLRGEEKNRLTRPSLVKG